MTRTIQADSVAANRHGVGGDGDVLGEPDPEPEAAGEPPSSGETSPPTPSHEEPGPDSGSALLIEAVVQAGGAGEGNEDTDPAIGDWLADQLGRIAGLAGVSAGQLSLAVVDDAKMAELHEQYKGDAGTTDVLTFDLRDDDDSPMEADIVVCLDEAARQSTERGHATRMELLLYAVHGLLHLLGYDDQTERDAADMHRREDELLTAAGFDPVYAGRSLGRDD